MSSAVVSTSAALGRHFLFEDESEAIDRSAKKPASPELNVPQLLQSKIKSFAIPLVTPASRLEVHPAPEMVTSGIATLDALTSGGLPRGCLTEIYGPASSGRTSVMLAALAASTLRGEYCALIDGSDALDPYSATAAGINLDRLLWVRCGENSSRPRRHDNAFHASERHLEQVLRATDLLLESGGFGLIVLDLADVPSQVARRIPLTTWFRFRRAVENKPTILLTIEQQPIAGSCSSLLLQLAVPGTQDPASNGTSKDRTADANLAHAQLLTGLAINAELVRSRLERKPARSVTFGTKTAWAG